MEKKRRDEINKTKNGLLLLIIGNFLGLGTLLGFLGGTGTLVSLPIIIGESCPRPRGRILAIIGAILVILGREIFGKTHSRQVLWSVGLYVGGGVISAISFLPFLFTLFEIRLATGRGAGLQDALVSDFYIWLIGQLIGATIYGLAYVLVTYFASETSWANGSMGFVRRTGGCRSRCHLVLPPPILYCCTGRFLERNPEQGSN